MPYITREMVEYMHRNGMTANSGGSGKGPRHSSKSTSASPDSSASRKRIRERPVNTELGNNNTSGSFALAAAATAHSGGGGSRSSSHKQQQQKHQNSPRQQTTAAPAAAPSLTTTPPPVTPELIGSRPATLAPAHDAVTHVSSKPAGVGGGGGGGGPPRAPSKTTKVGMDKSSILVLPPNSQQPVHQQQQKPTSSHYSSHKSASSSGGHSFSSQNWSSGSGSSSSQSASKTSPSSGGRSHKSGGQVSGLRRVASSGQATVQAANSSSHKSASGKKSKGGSHRVINVYHNAAANRGSGSSKSASSSSSSNGHSKHSPEQNSSSSKLDFDKAKVKFIHGLIRSNVQQFARTTPAEGGEKEFKQYVFDESKPFSGGGGGGRGGSGPLKPHSCQSMHEATIKGEKESASNRLLVKIYSTAAQQFPPAESFFKMLRHFGRKHPFIVATYDVFAFPSNKYNKQKSTYYVFQELATHRNALAFTKEHGPLAEGAVAAVGRQLRQAMDFIGDMGVCHRAIAPWHLLVFNVGSETTGGGKDGSSSFTIKVTGFRAAIIYYDDKRDDIHYQPCTPLPKRTNNSNSNNSSGKLPEFQAPETYGDPATEEFDPVAGKKVTLFSNIQITFFYSHQADVWSFGASLYYLLCCRYPYHFGHHRSAEEQLQQKATATFTSLEDEIQQSIGRLKKQGTVGAAGHSLLRQTLTTVSVARTTVDRLKDHPFIVQAVPRPVSAGGAAAAVQHPPQPPPNHPNNNTH